MGSTPSSPPAPESPLELELELDGLFRAPLSEFIAARNALAAAVKKRGDAAGSKRVKETSKPSPSAWAINQVFWRSRPLFDALIEAGDEYRRAQRAVLEGEARTLEEEERTRRVAIDEVERRAVWFVRAQGQDASPTLLRRIRTALEAIASYGSENPDPVRGRLVADVESPGFAALASLGPITPAAVPPSKESATPNAHPTVGELPSTAAERDREAGRLEEMEKAERDLAAARGSLDRATEHAAGANAELESARERLKRVEADAKLALDELQRERARVAELESTAARARRSWEETKSAT
jgi:hypothetical protein